MFYYDENFKEFFQDILEEYYKIKKEREELKYYGFKIEKRLPGKWFEKETEYLVNPSIGYRRDYCIDLRKILDAYYEMKNNQYY